ncbi:MAG: SMC-Scp complex subunit ScpB [Candidatus Nanopelagicales bacterium]|nr:SMC-Scp complex subunit ScpB [Candidatus Nanopelagicales bacterium]
MADNRLTNESTLTDVTVTDVTFGGSDHDDPAVDSSATALPTDTALPTETALSTDTGDSVIDVRDPVAVQISDEQCAAGLEALLMVTDQPITALELAAALEAPVTQVEETLDRLAAEYLEQGRGFELRNVAEGWRFYSAASCADIVAKYATEGRSARLTHAALETLAVVAYKQPVSRARIGAIRGVSVDGVMRTLIARGLVVEMETDPHTGAILYGTTSFFLERMGLQSVSQLPPIEDHLPDLAVLDELIGPSL